MIAPCTAPAEETVGGVDLEFAATWPAPRLAGYLKKRADAAGDRGAAVVISAGLLNYAAALLAAKPESR